MKVIVNRIWWDTDGDKALSESLPKEIVVDTNDLCVEDETDTEEILDAVSDYISNLTGFCHEGFEVVL